MKRKIQSGAVLCLLFSFVSAAPGEGADVQKPFHNGGMGSCDGCHAKTNKAVGAASPDAAAEPGRGMFNGEDPSSTCLICHTAPKGASQPGGHYVATNNEDIAAGAPPSQMGPAGDFAWLRKTYRWATREGGTVKDGISPGERHGHNIVAAQFGYGPDFSNVTAPGGSYPSDRLSCTSCHDPHGSYRRLADNSISTDGSIPIKASGSSKSSPMPDASGAVGTYRLLAGKGYSPRITDSRVVFTADPPAAVAPDIYNRAEPKGGDTRVAYGSDMSEWCRNCHQPHNHPTGNAARISPTVARQYNSYVASGNLGGSRDTAYTSLVPFESGTREYAELKKEASIGGNSVGMKSGENIMCLTCHRAHASGWDGMTRWNTKSELIVYNGTYPGIDNNAPSNIAQGRTAQETSKAYHDRPADSFGLYQRGLCSKCHAKD